MTRSPLLVCLDLQRAFLMEGPLLAPHAGDALLHCRRLLNIARERRWTLAFCYLRRPAGAFSISGEAARPAEGFEPQSHEIVFERSSLSAYGHPAFHSLMERADFNVVIAGLSASITFVATVFDAFERGHRFVFAADALAGQMGLEAGAREHEAVARDIAGHLGFVAGSSRQANLDGPPLLQLPRGAP
jgi:nicotinamidase-related amidase